MRLRNRRRVDTAVAAACAEAVGEAVGGRSKPAAGEYNAYYSRYIDLVPDGDILGTLGAQISGTLATLRAISDADSLKRQALSRPIVNWRGGSHTSSSAEKN